MINSAVKNVRNNLSESRKDSRFSVEGIMYLPYGNDDVEQQCIQFSNSSDGDQAEGHRYKGADFFIRFTYDVNAENLSHTMNEIVKNKDTLLDAAL
ncbi:hypothetical protein AAVH_34964 [Aphelenchoides avenae]|nr:hypothetical protein AAVH_34964 [Aphelenchus avenae]